MVSLERSARMGIESLRTQAMICRARARCSTFSGRSRGVPGNASSRYSAMALDSER